MIAAMTDDEVSVAIDRTFVFAAASYDRRYMKKCSSFNKTVLIDPAMADAGMQQ